MNAILEVKNLSKRFGGYLALNAVDCEVTEGRIHALIGPNGAGKTTLLNVISGVMAATAGGLSFAGRPYAGYRADSILAMGIARNFQQVRLFKGLSVLENVMVGGDARAGGGLWSDLADLTWPANGGGASRQRAQTALEFVGLSGQADRTLDQLTLVDQRRAEIARALASGPRLLLLDEPAGGMNPAEVQELIKLIRRIRSAGVTVLLVEHHMRFIMTLAEWITVLDAGQVIADVTPASIRQNPAVISAYLGRAE
jgi:branched-chain amino acid transport system ATP-binding protein